MEEKNSTTLEERKLAEKENLAKEETKLNKEEKLEEKVSTKEKENEGASGLRVLMREIHTMVTCQSFSL